MEETRKIGDYSVKYSMYIGHKDIALGENPNADKDERYMCCFVETNAIFERYSGVLVSNDFAEIAKVFGQRVADAAEEIIQENERACQEVGIRRKLSASISVKIILAKEMVASLSERAERVRNKMVDSSVDNIWLVFTLKKKRNNEDSTGNIQQKKSGKSSLQNGIQPDSTVH